MAKEFDDPVLKAAVQRIWGGQTAPQDLRLRIEQSMKHVRAPRTAWNRFRWPSLAAAAVILIGLSGWAYFANRAPKFAGQPLPQTNADALVATHQSCFSRPSHHLVPASADVSLVSAGQWLSSQLHVPIIATTPPGGWQYDGAGRCLVGGQFTGHFIYRRGRQNLSIFSVPPPSDACAGLAPNADYAAIDGAYWIVGFTRNGTLYCLVAYDPDGTLTSKEIETIRDSLKTDFSRDAFTWSGPLQPPRPLVAFEDDAIPAD